MPSRPLASFSLLVRQRYALLVRINTIFLLIYQPSYFPKFFAKMLRCLFDVICNTTATFDHATKHAAVSSREMGKYM